MASMEKKGLPTAQPKGKAKAYAAAAGKAVDTDWDTFEGMMGELEAQVPGGPRSEASKLLDEILNFQFLFFDDYRIIFVVVLSYFLVF